MMQISRKASVLVFAGLLVASGAYANDFRTGVGGALGGGAGAAVGNAVGGSTGAIVGGAVGGAAGGALGAQGSARTGAAVGGAIGGGAGAAVGNSVGGPTGAVVGAAVGGGAGAVVGGMVTEDGKPKTQAVRTGSYGGAPAYYQGSCNRNNPGKGLAKGHCK
ncbi:MAG: hypothetical protein MUF79_13945 [Burkholderiales bacterium]|jgi:hypothetical protein|nr:hypothetical protein [Burkholderiales bacterium]